MNVAFHDSSSLRHASPLGAARCEQEIKLSVFAPDYVVGGELIVHGESFSDSKRFPLLRQGELLCAHFEVPSEPRLLYYHFNLRTQTGAFFVGASSSGITSRIFQDGDWPDSFRLTVYDKSFETPQWFRQSIMYQIFPDRFARSQDDTAARGIEYHRSLGRKVEYHKAWSEPVKWQEENGTYYPNDFYGGTLRGIQEKLGYLKKLGVGVVYLNPIFEADSNHRYNTCNYLRIDPILGTEQDFIELCDQARKLGIRIILDGVFSHTGADSVYFNKENRYPTLGAYQGESSEYFSWFDFSQFPNEYRSWWGFPTLPEVCEDNPDWQSYIYSGEKSVLRHWQRAGASGWRLDVADELPDDVLRGIYKEAKCQDPDSVILGEVWEDPTDKISYGVRRQYALGGALDTVMNYPLRAGLIEFCTGACDANDLCNLLLHQKLRYPQPMYNALMNLISSHDVPRIRTALGADTKALHSDRVKQAQYHLAPDKDAHAAKMQMLCAVVQFSLPGVPCIYYGDETGMQGAFDPFNRAPLHIGEHDLTDFYVELAATRNNSTALKSGSAAFFAPDVNTLCILRHADGESVLAAINRSAENKHFSLKLSDFCSLEHEVPAQALDLHIGPHSWSITAV